MYFYLALNNNKPTFTKMLAKNTKTCIFYMQGRCKFGQKCYYNHDGFFEALMIRHAESEFNKRADRYPDWHNPSEQAKKQLHFNINLIDCPITPIGIQQAQKTYLPKEYLGKNKQIDIVFVSPLLRALQTAKIIIQSNRVKPKVVIVLPELTQVLSKICDFSSNLQQKKKRFQQFDFRQMQRLVVQSEQINQLHEWQDLQVDMDHYSHIDQKEAFGYRYLEILQKIFPVPLENSQRCFNRSIGCLQKMKEISEKLNAKKIVIVSHNRILKYLDGRYSKGRASSFQNCQVRRIIF